MTRDEYVELVKTAALDIAKRAVMKQLVSQVPFFAMTFPYWVAGLLVSKILSFVIQQSEFGLFFLYIDMRVDQQGASFEKAAHDWYNAAPEDKAKFEKKYLEAFYNLASLKS